MNDMKLGPYVHTKNSVTERNVIPDHLISDPSFIIYNTQEVTIVCMMGKISL
jgi:hypothetical protein